MSALLASQAVDNYVGLGIAATMLVLLVVVLIHPERF
jgi:hypothetical protein